MTNYSLEPSAMFAALSDASRCSIVERLCQGPATVSELGAPLKLSMPTLLQHLRVLESSGLISSTKAGRVRTCRLEPEALARAEEWIRSRRAAWAGTLARLDRYLTDEDP